MRAVRATIRACSLYRIRNPEQNEISIAYNAIRDYNIQKFTQIDSVMFESILRDIFPDQVQVKNEALMEK